VPDRQFNAVLKASKPAKRPWRGLLRGAEAGIALNAHYEAEGAVVYKHACSLGCEGIVSKRLGSPYRAGRAD
jgi:bifunctional non-homologous end joining protein LigD